MAKFDLCKKGQLSVVLITIILTLVIIFIVFVVIKSRIIGGILQ
jgi:hypothetical protein